MLTIHRLSEDKRFDADLASKMKGASWDLKMNAGEDIEECMIRERTDGRSSDAPTELLARTRTRRMYIRRVEVERHGATKGRPVCQKVIRASIPS